ncbi:hypothetical protein LK996_14875 [Lysobacter sp. A6]|uniref:Uncharacterized protein n=1 Tax=Noviluteimonas lactosilytica TaxID=2888523 RepID=A0ABS8JL66_9GAMM|nr:hypothetical protein [Lysobacter lactosilyticus]MCC8364355.1 hypothetical protein [Lysobacter lactosilyticus]
MHRSFLRRRWCALLAASLLPFATLASTVSPNNIVHLIENAQDIVVGTVMTVHDGIDPRGVPYTEVMLEVGEILRGAPSEVVVFRQFGLLQPRKLANGKTLYATRPQGWPEWRSGERVLLFLTPPASETGLRTTVGLTQGKFTIVGNRLQASDGERALFDRISVTTGLLDEGERRLLDKATDNYDANAFLAFVRRAVDQRWIETGSLRHAP